MLVTSKEMLKKAKREGYAVIQPDFVDNDSARVYCEVAEKQNMPIILAWAESYDKVISLEEAATIGLFYAKKSKAKVCLHLDHGASFATCKRAIDLGFTSVMIDASSDTFEENVRKTKEVVAYAHERGVVVEAEIGHVGSNGSAEAVTANESIYTEVQAAKDFVFLTDVDSLAVSIGTSHGAYKGTPVINFERLHELKEAIDIPLVLHGGSSSGDENLNRCATEGIAKINVFTDFLVAAHKATMAGKPDFYFAQKAMENKGMTEVMEHYLKVFETKGE